MALEVKRVEYYNVTVHDHIAEGSELLTTIADSGVDFLAYKAIPLKPKRTQFTLFPVDGSKRAFHKSFSRKHSPEITVSLANLTVRFVNLLVGFGNMTVRFVNLLVRAANLTVRFTSLLVRFSRLAPQSCKYPSTVI